MKVLLVHNWYQESGGSDVAFLQERDLLREAGHEVLEYERHNNEIKEYSAVRRFALAAQTVWASKTTHDFGHVLRQLRPAIVHAHNTFPLISPSIYWACRKEGVPVVQTLHNYRFFCPGANFYRATGPCEDCVTGSVWHAIVHACYRNSRLQTAPVAMMVAAHRHWKTWSRMVDRYIVLTDFARSRFVNAGLPGNKIRIKPNFVPDPGQRKEAPEYALFVGRLSQEKGIYTLLRAWRMLPRTANLLVIGDGPARTQLESETRSLGVGNVEFLGHLSRHNAIEYMKRARFVIFPSELYENLPLTIIEAFACGVPVLASNLGAMREIVEHGRTGMLFAPGNVADLARTALLAWTEPELMCFLGEQARREYEAKYTAATNYEQLAGIYQDVLQGRNTSGGRILQRSSILSA